MAGDSRARQLESLRRQMAAVPARAERSEEALAEPEVSPGISSRGVLAAPAGLAPLLPGGGLARGSVTAVTGSSALLLGLLAAVTADGGQAAVIGHRGLGLLAAVEMGADLSRIALVPDPGVDRVGVAAVLLDGMDLVVLDLDGAIVPPSRSRAVVARARNRGAALVVTGGEWEGAETRIDSQISVYEGLGAGSGRLRGMELAVRARGRSFAARTARLGLCPERGRMSWQGLPARRAAMPTTAERVG